jgi:nitrogen permease regulator 2-like protein
MASFPRLVAIFYATFDSQKGAKILVQAPDDAITPASSSSLFDFNSISEYIIPKKELCNRLLNICTPTGYRVLGYPVHIPGPQYERYLFIYNLAFVFSETGEIGSYIPVVRRLALTFKQLEVWFLFCLQFADCVQEQSNFLSKDSTRWLLHNVVEHILEDLNCYCECMSPISLNLTDLN